MSSEPIVEKKKRRKVRLVKDAVALASVGSPTATAYGAASVPKLGRPLEDAARGLCIEDTGGAYEFSGGERQSQGFLENVVVQELLAVRNQLSIIERGQEALRVTLESGAVPAERKAFAAGQAQRGNGIAERVDNLEFALASLNKHYGQSALELAVEAPMEKKVTTKIPLGPIQRKPKKGNKETPEEALLRKKKALLRKAFEAGEKIALMESFEDESDEDSSNLERSRSERPSYWSARKEFEEKSKMKMWSAQRIEVFMETLMGFVITLNAVYIGLAMDGEDDNIGWTLCNFLFTAVYLFELLLKIYIHGFVHLYTGTSKLAAQGEGLAAPKDWAQASYAYFDTLLVSIDVIQLLITLAVPDLAENMENAPSASMFRILRLMKLARLLKLLKSEVFADLLMMIQGMIGGTTTLFWAMVLFFLVMYVVSLLHREFYGRRRFPDVYEYFDSVPRSLLTTFRCGFGDCTTSGGVPIFEGVHAKYGWVATTCYLLFTFSISVGLFNVISAIFVESTMAAAQKMMYGRKKERLQDEERWAKHITILIRRLLHFYGKDSKTSIDDCRKCLGLARLGGLKEEMDYIMDLQIDCGIVDKMIKDEDAIEALKELDVDPEDNCILSDIFDPDNEGNVNIEDLVDGIRKLRGEPRRSDIVSVDLMLRSIQDDLDKIMEKVQCGQYDDRIKEKPEPGAMVRQSAWN